MAKDIILFDFGGTLDADGTRWSERFFGEYQAAGGRASFVEFDTAFRASDRTLEQLPGIGGLGFEEMVTAQAQILARVIDDLAPEPVARGFTANARRIVSRNRRVLELLAPRHRLGLISNFTGNLEICLTELGLTGLFEVRLDSAVEGIAKPDRRLFERAIDRLEGAPADMWMVGDSFDNDIRPAHALGMQTMWLAPAATTEPVEVTRRINALPEILGVLD